MPPSLRKCVPFHPCPTAQGTGSSVPGTSDLCSPATSQSSRHRWNPRGGAPMRPTESPRSRKADLGKGRHTVPRGKPPGLLPRTPPPRHSGRPPQIHTGPQQVSGDQGASSRPTIRTQSPARAAPPSRSQVGVRARSSSTERVLCPRRTERGCLARAHPTDSGPIMQTRAPSSCPGMSPQEASPSAMCREPGFHPGARLGGQGHSP